MRVVKRRVRRTVKQELLWERAKWNRTVKQPSGCAQSPLSSAFPIILLLGNFLCSTMKVLACWAGCQNRCTWKTARIYCWLRYTGALGVGLHELADYIHHLCVVISAHLALPVTCLHLWLCVAEAVRLFALGWLRSWRRLCNYLRYSSIGEFGGWQLQGQWPSEMGRVGYLEASGMPCRAVWWRHRLHW